MYGVIRKSSSSKANHVLMHSCGSTSLTYFLTYRVDRYLSMKIEFTRKFRRIV